MSTTDVINTTFIKRRRAELGMSSRALASATGTTLSGLRTLETGAHQGGLSLGFLDRLARALACDLADLIAAPATASAPAGTADGTATGNSDDDDGDGGGAAGDAARLGTVLRASDVLTPIAALADITDWPLARVTVALAELETRLPTVGLVLHRLGNRVAIRGAADIDGDLVAAAVRSHLNRDGLDLGEARVLRRILDGDVPRQPTNGEQVALAVLTNAGLVVADGPTGWRAHPDVAFSLGGGVPSG